MRKSAIFFSFFIGVGASIFAITAAADGGKTDSSEVVEELQKFRRPVVWKIRPAPLREEARGADKSSETETKEEGMTADGK